MYSGTQAFFSKKICTTVGFTENMAKSGTLVRKMEERLNLLEDGELWGKRDSSDHIDKGL